MKRMISALAVLAVVGAAFAFSPKEDNFCLYQKNVEEGTCPLSERPQSYTINSTTGGTKFIKDENPNGTCDAQVDFSLCVQQITTVND